MLFEATCERGNFFVYSYYMIELCGKNDASSWHLSFYILCMYDTTQGVDCFDHLFVGPLFPFLCVLKNKCGGKEIVSNKIKKETKKLIEKFVHFVLFNCLRQMILLLCNILN